MLARHDEIRSKANLSHWCLSITLRSKFALSFEKLPPQMNSYIKALGTLYKWFSLLSRDPIKSINRRDDVLIFAYRESRNQSSSIVFFYFFLIFIIFIILIIIFIHI